MGRHDEKDKKMIQEPSNWPMWPLLPVKRILGRGQLETGVLLAETRTGRENRPAVYIVDDWNLGDSQQQLRTKASKTYEYESIDAYLADGWEVD